MSQYGGNKSAPPPPWAQTPGMLQRPAYSEAGSSSIRASPITYQTPQPLGQQTLLQQPGLTPAMLMQQQIQQPAQVPYGLQFQTAQQQALLSQAGSALGAPGIALPTTLASTQPVMTVGSGGVAYPAGRNLGPPATGGYPGQQLLQQQQQQQPQQHQPKQRVFTGTITKLHDNFGFVDEDVFFQTNCIRGTLPKVGERVLVEAQYNANMPFKWNATRIQLLPNQSSSSSSGGVGGHSSSGAGAGSGSGGRSQALLTRGPPGVMANKGGAGAGAYSSVPPPSEQMPQSGSSSQFGGANRLPHSGRPRSPIRRVRALSREKERRRSRDRDESSSRRRSRSRSPRRRSRAAPRYSVHVPKVTLDMTDATVLTLKKRYSNLYIPSDFFSSRFLCGTTFPLHRPFQLATPVSYHVMHKNVEPVAENDAVYEPSDVDYRFCAKVMLLTTPSWEELYRRTTSLAELGDDADDPVHPSRLISFLVGLRGKNETMAIGGPWSPSRDGADPESDPQVLIKTAIRTCRALTGVDLSQCTKWYRVTEFFYRRGDKSTETVVLYLPDTSALLPSRVDWEKQQATYRQALQAKLNPAAAAAQDEKEEDDDEEVVVKQEPTNWAELDPKNMKVAELKQELELRTLSPKGLKSQLIARLTKVLKSEEEREAEERTSGSTAAAKTTPPPAPVPAPVPAPADRADTGEEDDTRRKDDAERRALEKKYQLPDTPQVVVHPHRTAKSGKFDCTVMSLSVLLDYRPEDNKEHSFEVSLFAEIFNEMLMRDAGFAIYRALVDAPEKVKEEKKSKDKKEEDKKEGDDEKKKEEKEAKKEEAEEKKKDEEEESSGDGNQLYTADKRLLMAFSYFDTSHCGYIIDRDLEDILQTVGLGVSRAQGRRLVAKVADRDSVPYRRLTDKPVPEGGEPADQPPPTERQLLPLAGGNWQHLPTFARPRQTAEGQGKTAGEPAEVEQGKPVMVMFEGSMVDLSSLMARVHRSDSTLQQTEKRMSQLQEEVRVAHEEAGSLRAEVKTLDHQLQLSRGSVTGLESQLTTSQETVGKYGAALDAVYAAVAPLVAEAERSAEQLRQQETAADQQQQQQQQHNTQQEDGEDMDTEQAAGTESEAKDDAKDDKTAKGEAKDVKDGKEDADAKVKEETPEPKAAKDTKEATPKTSKRTRAAATPDAAAKKAKVENGSSA